MDSARNRVSGSGLGIVVCAASMAVIGGVVAFQRSPSAVGAPPEAAVSDEIRGVCPILADEMALTNIELHLGSPRSVAMRRMADRTGAEEISSLVAVLLQSERFGTSISEALRIYAISMRDKRSQQAAENAEKMAVRLLFPMVIFIFPSILVVTVGPACVTLVEMMSD